MRIQTMKSISIQFEEQKLIKIKAEDHKREQKGKKRKKKREWKITEDQYLRQCEGLDW